MGSIENGFDFSILKDLNLYCCGRRIKSINHSYGPIVRERLLLTYINEGEAELIVRDNKKITLQSHDLMAVYPGEKMQYVTKEDTPWSITWIGVYGDQVEKFLEMTHLSRENPVIQVEKHEHISKILDELYEETYRNTLSSKMKCISMLYEFFSVLTQEVVPQNTKRSYVREAIRYMDFCYDRKMTLTEVAKAVNLEKSYFAKIFKKETGVTVTEWVRDLRIRKACQLLENTDLTVQQIAMSVGVDNQLYFSKIFKRLMKISPTEYRKRIYHEKSNLK